MLTVVVFGMGDISRVLQYFNFFFYNENISREIYKYFFRTSNQYRAFLEGHTGNSRSAFGEEPEGGTYFSLHTIGYNLHYLPSA